MDERYDMRRERVGGIHLPSDEKRDATEKVKANWLFYSFTGVFIFGTLAFLVWAFNIDLSAQDGKYIEFKAGYDRLLNLILMYWGGVIVFAFVHFIVSRLVLDIDSEEYEYSLGRNLMLLSVCSVIIIFPMRFKAEGLYNDAIAHNDAVTIEKLETAYDSAKKLDPDDSRLDNLPSGNSNSDAYPYLVKKDGEPHVLYISRDADKNTTTVISEIKVSKDGASVKVIE